MTKPRETDPGPKSAAEPDADAYRRAVENAEQHKAGTAVPVKKSAKGSAPAKEE